MNGFSSSDSDKEEQNPVISEKPLSPRKRQGKAAALFPLDSEGARSPSIMPQFPSAPGQLACSVDFVT